MILPACPSRVILRFKYNQFCFPFWRFSRLRNSAWDFFVVNFWSRNFLGVLFEALGIFFGFDIWSHSILPVTWNPKYSPTPHPRDWEKGKRKAFLSLPTFCICRAVCLGKVRAYITSSWLSIILNFTYYLFCLSSRDWKKLSNILVEKLI